MLPPCLRLIQGDGVSLESLGEFPNVSQSRCDCLGGSYIQCGFPSLNSSRNKARSFVYGLSINVPFSPSDLSEQLLT